MPPIPTALFGLKKNPTGLFRIKSINEIELNSSWNTLMVILALAKKLEVEIGPVVLRCLFSGTGLRVSIMMVGFGP